ncbi:phosphatase PAP2 family protein [Gemmatimonas groenlandica]|uniref:Inositolphosphotransferase Aur1/Ipt1 domain-containing protein n=1 Tax=Gemmatimonas groenlandica TaxID=2732249 RepID=A0A6M4ISN2_9BACT|nr:phosphatase PAP2 family protein [Gemmatimonas groenlandica]QJR35822.1 hypothetical protein HKW67_10020 [Gemmatimonas groenlandica]
MLQSIRVPLLANRRWLPALVCLLVLFVSTASVAIGHPFALGVIPMLLIGVPVGVAFRRGDIDRVGRLYFVHLAALLVFVVLRDAADETGQRVFIHYPQIVDRWLGLGELPTVRLQTAWYAREQPAWHDYLMLIAYAGHFLSIWIVAFYLWLFRVATFATYMVASAISYLIALPIHFALPTAPPWFASHQGAGKPVARVLFEVGRGISPVAYDTGMQLSGNDVAAVPSLHMAVAWMIVLSLWRHGLLSRAVAVLYAATMLWSIIYGGEHYLVDAVAGMLLAQLAWMLAPIVAWRTRMPTV